MSSKGVVCFHRKKSLKDTTLPRKLLFFLLLLRRIHVSLKYIPPELIHRILIPSLKFILKEDEMNLKNKAFSQ
jgi:hypothetical protein